MHWQAPVLQENSEDLFVFKVRSVSCCQGRLWVHRGFCSLFCRSIPAPPRLHSPEDSISSSSGLESPWRHHEGYSRSQTLSVMELCLCEPTESKFKAFKHQLFPSRIKCLFPELPFSLQLTNLIVINLSSIVSTFSKGTENRCDKCLNMRFNLMSVVLKKSYKTNCVLCVFNW